MIYLCGENNQYARLTLENDDEVLVRVADYPEGLVSEDNTVIYRHNKKGDTYTVWDKEKKANVQKTCKEDGVFVLGIKPFSQRDVVKMKLAAMAEMKADVDADM